MVEESSSLWFVIVETADMLKNASAHLPTSLILPTGFEPVRVASVITSPAVSKAEYVDKKTFGLKSNHTSLWFSFFLGFFSACGLSQSS